MMLEVLTELVQKARGKTKGTGTASNLICRVYAKGSPMANPYLWLLVMQNVVKVPENISATGSFWANSVPFASALATIPLAKAGQKERENGDVVKRWFEIPSK